MTRSVVRPQSTGLVYVEFKSRLPTASLQLFHAVQRTQGTDWADAYPDDVQLLNVGRTWRLGPEPAYLTVFYTPNGGLERINAWESIFMSGEVGFLEAAGKLCSRVERAGCYECLLEPLAGAGGPYYIEYFDVGSALDQAGLAGVFRQRESDLGDVKLNLLATRIGLLGPSPGGLAVWSAPTYVDLGRLSEDSLRAGLDVVEAGVYADVGREII